MAGPFMWATDGFGEPETANDQNIMKTIIGIISLMAFAIGNTYGQGSVGFANASASRVWMTNPDGSTSFATAGSRFLAELVFAPDGTPTDSFTAVATRAGAPATFFSAGLYGGGGRTVQGISPAGGFGLFQVRVWEAAAGADYVAAVATGNPQYQAGTSVIMRIDTGDPTTVPPGTPTPITSWGLNSFVITPIPEPSIIALGLISVGTLLMLRRRR